MNVTPIVLVRALITRLSPEERIALVGELLDGAAAATRPVRTLVTQPCSASEVFDDVRR